MTDGRARVVRQVLLVGWLAMAAGVAMTASNMSACDPTHCERACHDGECCDDEDHHGPSYGQVAVCLVVGGGIAVVIRRRVPNPDVQPPPLPGNRS